MMSKYIVPFPKERFKYSVRSAASIGKDAIYWIKQGDPQKAYTKARNAARWAMKAEALDPQEFSSIQGTA